MRTVTKWPVTSSRSPPVAPSALSVTLPGFMEIIGLTGKIGAGKDTAGAYLVERYGYERRSFAALLKQSAAALLMIEESLWETIKNEPGYRIILEAPGGYRLTDITARTFLQRYGTEAHRDIFSPDFWVEALFNSLERQNLGKVVITDVRFENEARAVVEAGGRVLEIQRPLDRLADNAYHPSEAGVPDELIDAVIFNDLDIPALHRALDNFLR